MNEDLEYKMYERFCKPRFEKIEQSQTRIEEDVIAIREKVFNGFGAAITELRDEMKSLRIWIIGLMGTVVLAVLGGLVKFLFFP